MNPTLQRDILDRLTDGEFEGEEKRAYVRRVRCPDCHKREAWAKADAPWMLYCGRLNQCGAKFRVQDLFPELFDNWTERYTPKGDKKPHPTAVADGYLRDGRGFDLDLIRGTYTQESYYNAKINAGSTTVRFELPGGAYWERILDKPHRFGKRKANFHGEYKGEAWHLHQAQTFLEAGEVWIVEGIFDAIALAHHGIPALAAMSASNFPGEALQRLRDAAHEAGVTRPSLVWALDSNKAGREATFKHIERARAFGWQNEAAQPPAGWDWNDLHQRGELEEPDVERYRYYGALLLAPSPTHKALLIYKRRERREFWFEYRRQLWWFKLDPEGYNKALKSVGAGSGDDPEIDPETDIDEEVRDTALQQAASVTRICTAYPTALYYQQNVVTDESWYYWRVESPGGAAVKNTFSGGQLSSASEFKKRLLGVAAGAVWTGTSHQLDTLLQDQIGQIKSVETIDYIGYSREHGAYVLGDLAISRGRLFRMTHEDYFELGRLRLKSLSQSVALHINPEREQYRRDWIEDLVGAYGANGAVALAFWLGSLFAEQIRAQHKSYPFLEIVGEAGAGKSTLIEFMWKLLGRVDYEGFDPVKASMPARARNFAQVSNLPVVLIESDRDQDGGARQRQFDWDELKTAYNGRSIRARGVKNSGNETYEPPFRGAIVISQNAEVQASQAIQTRICHLMFSKADQTSKTKELAENLERARVEDVSGFILEAALAEARVLEIVTERTPSYETYLLDDPDIRALRIAKNHAQLLALVDCLGPDGLGLIQGDELAAASRRVVAMARERQVAVNADHPVVEEFWEAYDYIESLYEGTALNHYGDHTYDKDGLIAINLKDYEHQAGKCNLHVAPARELKRYLRGSRSRKFIEANRVVKSRIRDGSTVRCWIFQEG